MVVSNQGFIDFFFIWCFWYFDDGSKSDNLTWSGNDPESVLTSGLG